MRDKLTVLLVDDHALVRRGFRRILEDDPEIEVVGEASDGEEAVRLAAKERPHVIVMDCAMPGMNGLEATRRILEARPDAAILMLSMHSEDTLVRQALDAGASGYILKNAIDLDLANAVKRVAKRRKSSRSSSSASNRTEGRTRRRADAARTRSVTAHRGGKIEQGDRRGVESEREYRIRASREHHGRAGNSQDGRACGLRDSKRPGEPALRRRDFIEEHVRERESEAAISPARLFARITRRSWLSSANVTAPQGFSFSTTAALTAESSCRRHLDRAARSSITTATAGRTSC